MQALEDDDDFVAELLKRDAKDAQHRSAAGVTAPPRRRPDAPKPNLRFLKNVLRDVGSHNAELKAKEEEQSQRRAREMRERGTKRRREDDASSERSNKRKRGDVTEREGRWKHALSGLGLPTRSTKGHKSSRRNRSPRDESHRRHEEQGEKSRRKHRRERSRSLSRDAHEKHSNRRSEHRSRSRSPEYRRRHDRKEHRSKEKGPTRRHRDENHTDDDDPYEDSDPLEAIVGPMPPPKVKARGRGNTGVSSSIDARFRADYDPKADVAADEGDNDDWSMALEAVRDRAKWKANGAERLKAAGFTDQEVERWEKGGEKDIGDVRWSKKGEAREWDQGKVMDDDGEVQLKPEWGRLKGT